MDDTIIIRMPASHWSQIVSDLENYCGLPQREIEILADVEVLGVEQARRRVEP